MPRAKCGTNRELIKGEGRSWGHTRREAVERTADIVLSNARSNIDEWIHARTCPVKCPIKSWKAQQRNQVHVNVTGCEDPDGGMYFCGEGTVKFDVVIKCKGARIITD
jgi:hypothetical protein